MTKKKQEFKPEPLTWQTQATFDRMTMDDLFSNGIVRRINANPNTVAKPKTGKANKQRMVDRAWKRRDKQLQEMLDEAAELTRMKLPLVLHFQYIEPSQRNKGIDMWNVLAPHINAFAWWTCPTPHGTFITIKHSDKKMPPDKRYESFFVRYKIADSKITLYRSWSEFSDNRNGSLAKLCGRRWVYNFGKWYSLYDLFSLHERGKRESSIWFWFEDEMGIRTEYPRKHHNENLLHIDHNNNAAYWFWEMVNYTFPIERNKVPEPTHQSDNSRATGDRAVPTQDIGNGAYQLDSGKGDRI